MANTRLPAFPKKTGFGPNGTIPALVSPETSICISLPSDNGAGLVDKVIACASVPGSPLGPGTGTINCRKVSLQPAATSIKMPRPARGHTAFQRDFIKTPPVLPV